MSKVITQYECKICNKSYASYQSLWIHNKKFHTIVVLKTSRTSEKTSETSENILKKNYNCRKCNKVFHNIKTRWSHEKICNFNTVLIKKNQILKTDIVKINDQSNTIVKMNKSPNNNSIIQNNIFIQNPINDNTITFNDKKIKYFSYKDQLYFKAKDIMQIIGYEDTKQFIRNNIDDKHKIILKNFINNNQVDYELKNFLENQEPKTIYINKNGYDEIIKKTSKDTKNFNNWFNNIYLKLTNKIKSNEMILYNNMIDTNNFTLFYDNINIKYFILNDKLYFKAKDVAILLEYPDTKHAITDNINPKDIFTIIDFLGHTPGGGELPPPLEYSNSLVNKPRLIKFLQNQDPQTVYINESGLYKLVLNSKKTEAKKFQDWVTSDVLISIRKTGEYKLPRKSYDITNIHQLLDKNCVYILYLHDNIYKFGKSTSLSSRLENHRSKLNYNNIVQLFDFPTAKLMERFENIIRIYSKEEKINIKYYKNDIKGLEYFQTDNEAKLLDDLDKIYKNMIEDYQYEKDLKIDNDLSLQIEKTKQLEIIEKTKQLEITEKTKQLEIEQNKEQEKTKQLELEQNKEEERTKQLELEIKKLILQLELLKNQKYNVI